MQFFGLFQHTMYLNQTEIDPGADVTEPLDNQSQNLPVVPTTSFPGGGLPFEIVDETALSLARRLELISQHGNFSLAYSTAVQPELQYFGNNEGYIAYRTKYGYVFALADPVAAKELRAPLVDAFIKRFSKPSFCHISTNTADILAARKFRLNEMGFDTRLDLASYSFSGKEKERFRYAANWLARHGYRIEELNYQQIRDGASQSLAREVEELTQHWRGTRTLNEESAFLNRPIVYDDEVDVRKFFLIDPEGRLAALLFFDPIYDEGQLVGYVTSFKRRLPAAPKIAEQGISKLAIERFAEEGRQLVKLGLAPLAELEDRQYRCNRIMHFSFGLAFKSRLINRYFYNLQGHADFKSRYRGEKEKIYYASPVYVNDLRLVAMLRLTKVI
jgi:phosphatidylglycerol lysyltransferase